MTDTGIGASVKRKEDFRFLTGEGRYTDDINRPGQLHAVLRALARGARQGQSRPSTGRSRQAGRRGRGRRLRRRGHGGGQRRLPALRLGRDRPQRRPAQGAAALAAGPWQAVRYVGDHVAVVIAETSGRGARCRRAGRGRLPGAAGRRGNRLGPRRRGAEQLHDEAPGNLCYDWELGDKAAVGRRLRPGGTTSASSTWSTTG